MFRIGVFDSGLGGLTVVQAIRALMPGLPIEYLGDTARVPYGIRSRETVERYAIEGTEFLKSRGIGLMVVACNTVSAMAMDAVSSRLDIPATGVIVPGARAAIGASKTRRIGVIGTEGTVSSGAYLRAIRAISPDAEVIERACPLFVPLVEEGWLEGEVPMLVASRYLSQMKASGIDTLVLGCTHYPLLKPVLAEVMGPGVTLIDSATETALEIRRLIEHLGVELSSGAGGVEERFYVTDSPDKFVGVGQRFLNRPIVQIEKVEV